MVGTIERTLLLGLLLATMSGLSVLPVHAVPRNPKGDCFEVSGVDLQGMYHEAAFYRRHTATTLAGVWASQGWTNIIVEPC